MLLSKLVYLSIKNVIYQNDGTFTYESFMNGNFDNDIDLSMQINNAFSPLNEAIARLNDLNRIPYRFEKKTPSIYGEIETGEFSHDVKEIIGVMQNNEAIAFKQLGSTLYLEKFDSSKEAIIEYKEDIKFFTSEDLVELDYDELGGYEDHNIDLKQFGLSDSMCNYIIEYVKGKLLEPIAPELANLHITTAEQYFAALNQVKRATIQTIISKKYSAGI